MLLTAFLALTSCAFSANIIHEFYVPLPESQVKTALTSIEPASGIVGNTIESVVSIVVTGVGTVIHYDQWEDGYEVDLNNPTQSTTQIWGDGNDANGIPPGYAHDPASFPAGSVIVLRNQIPLPRNPANLFFDGRDRFGGTKALVVSRASWATTPGTVLCGANEILATMDYGTQFVAPVGDDVSANSMFEFVGVFVMARDDGTSVTIDPDGAGATAPFTITLNRGESYLVNGGIKKGATIDATKPVQAHLITGDIGARYESRRFTLYPRDQWSNTTYSPVGTASNGDQSYAFLYNPQGSALTINVTTGSGTSNFSVPAGGVYQYQLPQNQGAKFASASGLEFFGIVTVGANPTANNVHDWGFSMVPFDNLTPEAVVGWGPGSSDLSQNGSPVWVTPTAATRVYVDYNGDRAGSLTDPLGGKYDAHYDLAALQSQKLFDPDKDQTAMRLYTLDGTTISTAWGQDPATAGPGNPFLDCGTTVLPFPVPVLKKTAAIYTDTAPSGLSIGDTIEYTVTVDNRGLLPLGNLLVLDPLNPSLTYVANSTTRDGIAIPDGSSGTPFPLDEGGYTIPIILRGGNTVFKYRATINSAGSITNTVNNITYNLTADANLVVPPPAGANQCGAQFTNSSGTTVTSYVAGASVYATMTDPDANHDTGVAETVTVAVNDTTSGDSEFITLTETGVNTGVFRNVTGLPTSTSSGGSTMDGTLHIGVGDNLSFTYTDPQYHDVCTGNATISAPTQNKFLYLSDPAQALDRVDPVATSDATTSSTATLGTGTATITTVGAAAFSNSAQTASSHSFSYDSGSTGSNRILMVGISYRDNNSQTVSSVTYNGVALTQVGTSNIASGTPDGRMYIYRLLSPATGAHALVVNWSAALTQGSVIGAVTYAGVDQTTPTGTFVANSSKTGTPTVTITSGTGKLAFGVCGGRTTTAYTVTTSGGTSLWSQMPFSGQTAGSGQSAPGAASVTMTWNGTSTLWCAGGVSLNQATGGGTPTATFTQAPTFASTFTMPSGVSPIVTAYYTIVTGSMPASPSITATLKKGATAVATSTSASASGGLLTFNFSPLVSAVNYASGETVTLDITTAETGVTFTVDYDSSTKPSKITLPTTTVIKVTSIGVYDAPYPGGSLITSPTSGTTAYVRAVVSDPFGNADITSLGLNIDGPGTGGDVTTTLSSAVATTTGTKTYEYAWSVGSTTGVYNIVGTAHEGTEGIIDTNSTQVNVTQLDLGTPSTTQFTTGLNGPHTATYSGNEQVCVRVTDLDQNTDSGVVETVTATITAASGDSEVVTLTETGANTGVFVYCIPASTTAGSTHNDGTLHAVLGDVLYVVYVDPTDSTDTSNDTATIPNIAPAVTVNKTLVAPSDGQAVIGEAVQYSVQVINTGNTTLSTIALADTYPAAKLSYVSASVAPNTVASGSLNWTNVGPLSPGQSRTITLNFTALASAAPATNTATADAGGGVTGGDTADVTITHPALAVSKTLLSPNPGPANIGDNVVFRISLHNTGDTAIATLPLEDTFSGSNFDFVSATVPPDSTGNGDLLWLDVTGAGNLAVGATTTIDVTLKAKGAAAPASNVASADYTVDVNGDPVPPASSTATITLVAAKISGHVYDDVNTNAAYNAGVDGFLSGITVTLYTDPNGDGNPADGTLVAVTTTDTNGYYEFVNLAAGNYVAVESQPPGYSSSGDSAGANDNRVPVVVSTLTTYSNKDFFDYLTPPVSYASISGKVWNDANANGIAGVGEIGIPNAAVDLVEDTNGNGIADLGEPVTASMLTAPDGTYSFGGLPAGNYVVVEHDLFGWYSTADSAPPNNNMIPVTAASGSSTTNRDFMDVQTGTVGGKVFQDVNGNGTFDGGDVALAGIDVIVTDSLGAAQTVTTDASGNWTATVPPGNTTIDVQQSDPQFTAVFSAGYTQTAGTDPNSVTAVSSTNTPAGDDGFRQVATVTGHLYLDENGNGTQDPGEPDLADVDVVITKSDSTTMTVTTDSNGNWTATVPPGSTTANVDETDPDFAALVLAGYTQTQGVDPKTVTAVANSSVSAGTNGYFNPGSISGTVLADTDNDDVGDTPMVGVVLTLLDGSGNVIDGDTGTPGVQPITATTNASGVYIFNNLPPGNYRISETQPAGYASISDRDGGDLDVIGDVVVRVLDPGEHETGNNFVEEQYGSITGTVLKDTNNDDVGDAPFPGVVLTLLDISGAPVDGDPNTPGVQPITATTNASGVYTFTNVPPGEYRIGEAQPAGYQSVSDADGGNLDQIGDVTLVVITAGGTNSGNNFVEEQLGTISGSVLADTNNDNIGDVGVQNVTVTLFSDPNGDGDPSDGAQIGSPVQTDVNGDYTFINVAPGNYVVVKTPPAGYLTVADGDTTNPNDDAANVSLTDNRIPVGIVAGETDDGNTFVVERAMSVGNLVFIDANHNGHYDSGEGVTGVKVRLYDNSDTQIDEVTTGAGGLYLFTNVAPGSYYVKVPASEFASGKPLYGRISVAGTQLGDDDVGEDGIDDAAPATNGIRTALFSLIADSAPTDGDTETGVNKASDNANDANSDLTIDFGYDCPSIALAPASLAAATVGTAYSQTITASGGVSPYTYAVTLGTLPAGLTLSSGGVLSGTPTSTTSQTFTITATDNSGCAGSRSYTLTPVCPSITLASVPAVLPSATNGTSYSASITASGGTPSYTYAVTGGALPTGLSLSSGGAISGTPNMPSGSANFTVTATDANGCSGSALFTISVDCPTISISPSSLSNGTVGTAYGPVVFSASGGSGAITWQQTGTLPAGMTFNTGTHTLSGTPTETGNFSISITATDANSCSGSVNLSFSTSCPAITVNPASLPNGTVNTAYSQTVTASGGTSPYSFAVTLGTLPAGLSLAANGDITGTPTSTTAATFTITATDANGCTGARSFTVTPACPTITVNPATLPDGTVNTAYNQTVTATGGIAPYSFAVTLGSLPAGLTMTGGGVISGTPSSTTAATFTITATDANNCTGARSFTVTPACPAITVNPATLPDGTVNAAYNQTVSATGGIAPYSFAVTAGVLPTGLSMTSGGVISGTPTSTTAQTFTITATDANNCTGARSFTVTPACPTITVAPTTLPDGTVNTAYNQTVSASGGIAPYSFAVTLGSLPAGLSMTSGGVISGTPTSTTAETFTVTTTDANNCTGTRSFTVTPACPAITVAPASLPNGVVGTAYNQTVSASGGITPYSFAVTVGTLPAGLSLAANGDITGTPTSTTAATFTITATDANSCTGSRSFTVTPACPAITLGSVPAVLPGATNGTPYSAGITASGGTPAYTYALTGGALPNGLTMDNAGAISGTPNGAAGASNFTVTATDANGCSGSALFTISLGCPTINIAPGSLSNGTVGTAYGPVVFNATGGSGAITWQQTGTLPAGMSFNTGTATLSGTPTEAGNFSISIAATDTNNCSGSVNLSFSTSCPAITVNPATLPDGTVNTAYAQTVTASGGTAPYSFAVTLGTLPAGLSLAANGDITGTPTSTTAATFTITATDANGCTGARSFTVTPACPAITVNPSSLPNGTVNTFYNQTVTASGGIAPYSFAVTLGTLPAGLTLSGGGALTGTPTSTTAATFTITATDANNCTGTRSFTITPACPTITVNPSSLADGTVNTPYSATMSAAGGIAPYTFGVTAGSLPAGLSLAANGDITGTPTSTTAETFTITATDANGCTGARSFTVTPACPTITLNPTTLPNGTVNTAYSQTVTASGGIAPYTFAVTLGTLPDGLSLAANGDISGTPTSTTAQTFTITATDANNCTGTRSFTVTPACPSITVNPASLPNGVVGTAYSQTVSATGGIAPYSFTVTVGVLPTGLSLATNGDITGTPTSTTAQTFTITATDANNCTGTRSFTVTPVCPAITVVSVPAVLPAATNGAPYSASISASGGTPAYTYAVTGGALPNGLSMDNAGAINGIANMPSGSASFTVTATDANGCSGSALFTISVDCPTISVAPGSLSNGTVGTAYGPVVFNATGGSGLITWQQTGTLPAGITFNTGTATLSGTPTQAGSYSISIVATDANGCSGSVNLSFSTSCPAITVNPATLPNGTVNTAYSQTATATGGTSPYSFAVTLGALPAGLSLAANGDITGTPTSTSASTFTITATDANGCTGARSFTVTPACPVIAVNPATLPNGTVNTPYNQTVTASGGIAPYSFAVTLGTLPVGLTMTSGGVISGTPTSTTAATFTITATDANNCTGTRSFTVTPACPAITVNPASLPNGTVNSAYNQTITATGGIAPYSFAVTLGTLPTGLTLTSGGVLSGTPTSTTAQTFTITATDANNCAGTRSFTITPACPTITVNPFALPDGVVNSAYNQTVSATGGIAPYSFVVTLGSLPAGLNMTSGGVISGTPTSTTSETFTITGTDANGCAGNRVFTVTPACPTININPPTLANGVVGTAYNQTLTASGGIAPYSYEVSAGVLPDGLSLALTGEITGTPTSTTTQNFMITATDANGCTRTRSFTISPACPTITLASVPAVLPAATNGTPYSASIAASGGTPNYTYAITGGGLPIGLTMNNSGAISGTPNMPAGSANFTVTATDANGCQGSSAFTISVGCPTISIAPGSLSNGTVGTPYGPVVFNATGGSGAIIWQQTGALPAGMMFDLVTATLSGTPTVVGSYSISITATDANGCSGSVNLGFSTSCPAITVNPAALPDGTVNTPYSQIVTASGGTSPYSFAVTLGTLPAGLALAPNGDITGTPTSTTAATFTITATDANGCTGTRSFTITPACPVITINPVTLPNGTVNTPYSQTVTATGGIAPYTFAVTIGTLPAGLALAPNGDITGTPTSTTAATFTITATDANGCTGARSFTVTPACPVITVSPATLPNGTVNAAYNVTVTASGGIAPYSFAVTLGTLPTGLSLAPNGDITGTPTSTTAATFTITATDANGCTGMRSFTVTPACPVITINPATLPDGTVNAAYTQTLNASGGIAPYSFAVTLGSLPAGLSLAPSGDITGTPTSTTPETFTVTVTDANGCTGTRSFTVTPACPAITVNPATLPDGVVGTAYTQTVSATGGIAPYSFAVTVGVLPAGLSLAANGDITGTPTSTTAQTFTITATDANSCTGTRSFTVAPVCPAITVASVPAALPAATNGAPYSASITASGGTPAYTYAVTGGALPNGLSLSSAGAISGTPNMPAGSANFTVTATDANGCSGSALFTISVGCPTISIAPGSLSNGVVGTAYGPVVFNATGGTGAITWQQTGTLPAGMTFNTGTATLSGTPTEAGSYTISIVATDANNCSGSVNLSFSTSCPAITVNPASLPSATLGAAYNQTITASGGTSPYAFAVTAGALPPGLTLASGGTISGAPTTGGSYPVTITATDANGCTGARSFTLDVIFGTVTGHLYLDTNGNGVQNIGEPDLANVDVVITDSNGATQTVSTNGAGNWTAAVPPGTTTANVDETDPQFPAGALHTQGDDPTTFTAIAGTTTNGGIDGYFIHATVVGHLYLDSDGDGTQSLGEPDLPNVDVIITDSLGRALLVTTDVNGDWSINVPPGETTANVQENDPDYPAGSTHTEGTEPTTITALANTTNDGGTDGYYVSGTVAGHLYLDVNGNGTQDPGEPDLANVNVVVSDSLGGVHLVATDGNGDWTVSVPPGTTIADVDENDADFNALVLAGYVHTQGDDPTTVTAVAGNIVDGGTDGYFNPGSLSGFVLADTDDDDVGDSPIQGVLLALLDGFGSPVDGDPNSPGVQVITITTDVNGQYTFGGLPPGAYQIAEVQPAGYASVSDRDGGDLDIIGDVIPRVLDPAENETGNDFVEEQYGSITGTVLADTNNDDTGDTGIPGVVLTLLDLSGAPYDGDPNTPGVQPVTTTTDGSGTYSFTSLLPGQYRVGEAQPAGYQSISDLDGGNLDQIGDVVLVNVTSGGTSSGNDFVEEQLGTISGSVLADTDNDNAGDAPLSGVVVALFSDPNGDGNPNDGVQIGGTVLTNASGAYTFGGVQPGSYVVVETPPAGYIAVTDGDTTTPGDDAVNASTADHRIPVAVVAGETDDGNNFVEEQTGSISGAVLADTNNDNAGDAPISGVVLTLLDGSGNVIDGDAGTPGVQPVTATTNGSGAYSFGSLPPGSYRVGEAQPAGYASVSDADGGNLDVIGDVAPIVVVGGAASSGNDFVEEQSASIGNLVWIDANNNGIKDVSETGLDGVVVELLDGSGNPLDSDPNTGGIQPTTSTTAGGGLYSFSNLPPGSYRLTIATPPALYPISSTVTDTNDDVIDNDDNGSQIVAGAAITSPVFTLSAGETDNTKDFGLVAGGTIGNLVWHDTNGNGVKESGETGIDGVSIALLDSLGAPVDDPNTPGVQAYIVTTSSGGAYGFSNLAPGSYQLRIATPPAAYPESSPVTNTSDDAIDGDDNGTQAMPTAVVTSPLIALSHGEADNTKDFGFLATTGQYSISGQVRDDYDLDGNFSDADQPVGNVTIKLYADSNGNGSFDSGVDQLLGTTTTDGIGHYQFNNLPSGTYFVQEVDPNPSNSTADVQGANDNLIKVVILSGGSGASSVGNDFLDAVDPTGYIYSPVTGKIVAGGSMSVSGPGSITILMDGSTGQYGFVTDTAGTFTLTYTPPIGYMIDPSRPVAGPSFDPTGGPDPTVLGSSENPGNPGFLTNFSAAGNSYYLTFVLAPGDPFVINNNIPVVEIKPTTFAAWQYANQLGGQNGVAQNADGDRFDNLQEYAFCYAPNTGVSIGCPLKVIVNSNGRIDATVRKAAEASDVIYTLEYIADIASSSANGGGWTPVTTIVPTTVNNGDGTATSTYLDLATLPGLTPGRGFVRIKVDLDANHDTVPEQTTRTLASGWDTRSLSVQCQTCSMPFFVCDVFSGVVDSLGGGSLNVATSAGTGNVAASFVSGKQYYIEVLSGDNAGHRFDVDEAASTATTLAISTAGGNHNTLGSIPANIASDVIAVRQHYTMDDIFTKSLFHATNNQTTADRLLFYSSTSGTFSEIYWLYLNGGVPKWVLSTDATLTDRGSRVIDPAEAMYVHCRTTPVSLVLSGHVRQNSFACPLKVGSNLIGSGFPMDQSPAMRQMTLANGFTGGRDPAKVDQIRFWAGDATTGAEAYISHFLVEYNTLHQWSPQSNASLTNENNFLMFKSLQGAFVKSIAGKSNWVIPMTWTP
ncbi:MAG: putative Ig domain-containing protein [Verrucomicrobiaceae bacterium]|nr:putative Ig domain-containing protein [Verrucomicrobiaceae bacterium]